MFWAGPGLYEVPRLSQSMLLLDRAGIVGVWCLNRSESLCPLPMTSGAAVQYRAAIAGAPAPEIF